MPWKENIIWPARLATSHGELGRVNCGSDRRGGKEVRKLESPAIPAEVPSINERNITEESAHALEEREAQTHKLGQRSKEAHAPLIPILGSQY